MFYRYKSLHKQWNCIAVGIIRLYILKAVHPPSV